MEEKDRLQEELQKVKDELATQSWGLKKTNEAIKFLYKELEKRNKELQELDNLKSDFLNAVSHELRTPLTTIREVISQIQEGLLGETSVEQRKFLSICLENVDRLKRMIDNLLDISKLEAGKFKITREEVDIVNIAKGVITAFYPKSQITNLEIREKFLKHKAIAYVDRDSIVQVFTNLINNAFKFTDKGYIEVSVKDNVEYVECSVSDTGRGISPDDLPKVFSKFQQFGKRSVSQDKGTGLGLSIAKNIIELHHGKIWVESTLNKGTKFTFTLPKYTAKIDK
jgi:signal transduction histidine kinase